MKREYIVTRQGKELVLYEGLLDEAHNQGLRRISTTLIQIPHEDNGRMAVVQAEVETERGSFGGIGDASPQNVRRAEVHDCVRVAEVRAKARALRDAVNVGMLSVEELGEDSPEGVAFGGPRSASESASARESGEPYRAEMLKAEPPAPEEPRSDAQSGGVPESVGRGGPGARPATANQLATIAKLSRLLGHAEEPGEGLTSAAASERITELSREYNERKGGTRRSA